MSTEKKVLVIVPAYNEEETIVVVLNEVKIHCPKYDILVINDDSRDATSQLAKSVSGVAVIDLPVNLGIGGAVQTGLKYAEREGYDVVVQFDADGQHRAEDLTKLVGLVNKGKCDVAIGSRFVGNNRMKDTDFFRRLGIRIFEYFSLILIQKRIKDHTSGFRAFNRRALVLVANDYPVDYPEPEIIVLLARNKFTVKEVFTQMYSRQGGVSSISLHQGPYYMFKVMLAMLMAVLRPKNK